MKAILMTPKLKKRTTTFPIKRKVSIFRLNTLKE